MTVSEPGESRGQNFNAPPTPVGCDSLLMESIAKLWEVHAQQRVFIFGKGPSLDAFDFSQNNGVRMCVNESLKSVNNCDYFFAHDEKPIQNVAADWPKDCKAILEHPRAELARECGISEEAIYTYTKVRGDNAVRDLNADGIARQAKLYGNSGTVHCAIHFCRLIGAAHVTLVGFDGAGGYAESLQLPPGGAQHERIRQDAIALLKAMKLPYAFFGGE